MGRTFKSFSYNYERISAKDIVEFIENDGYIVNVNYKGGGARFTVAGSALHVRIPIVMLVLKSNFGLHSSALGDILFNTYDDIYYPEKQKYIDLDHTFGPRNEVLFIEHDKLFHKLKRKFQMKRGELPKAIKDLEWIRSLEK